MLIEALHLSEAEENTINNTVANIKSEYEQRIDNHSQRVIVSNIELLLNYCLRFYERQFNTRVSQHKDVISQFEAEIKKLFQNGHTIGKRYAFHSIFCGACPPFPTLF